MYLRVFQVDINLNLKRKNQDYLDQYLLEYLLLLLQQEQLQLLYLLVVQLEQHLVLLLDQQLLLVLQEGQSQQALQQLVWFVEQLELQLVQLRQVQQQLLVFQQVQQLLELPQQWQLQELYKKYVTLLKDYLLQKNQMDVILNVLLVIKQQKLMNRVNLLKIFLRELLLKTLLK